MKDPGTPAPADGQDPSAKADPSVLSVAEETASISKRQVDLGGIRVETRTEEFTDNVTTELAESRVEFRRVPVDRVVTEMPQPREEDGITIIPVVAERPVLTTELVLVEEIHIVRTETTRTVEVPVTLRRQHVLETELPAEPAADNPDISTN